MSNAAVSHSLPPEILRAQLSEPVGDEYVRPIGDAFFKRKKRLSLASKAPKCVQYSAAQLCGSFSRLFQPNTCIIRNPNKAIVIVSSLDPNLILTCNILATRLFDLPESKIIGEPFDCLFGRSLAELVACKQVPHALDDERLGTGAFGIVSDIRDAHGVHIPVALWLNDVGLCPTSDEGRICISFEPVQKSCASLIADVNGMIFSADDRLATMFDYDRRADILGLKLKSLVPALRWPPVVSAECQFLTGVSRHGLSFPLCMKSRRCDAGYDVQIDVYTTLSGLITINSKGTIIAFNEQFVGLLLGYSGHELENKHIDTVIPMLAAAAHENSVSPVAVSTPVAMNGRRKHSGEPGWIHLSPVAVLESSTLQSKPPGSFDFPDGSYWGYARHKDGSLLSVGFDVRSLPESVSSEAAFGIWITRDPEFASSHHIHPSSWPSPDTQSPVDAITNEGTSTTAPDITSSWMASDDVEHVSGDYAANYATLSRIGKGAFGYVKLAARKSDGLLVVTKFIKKSRIRSDSWVNGDRGDRIPIEIQLLTTLDHPHIVRAMCYYENVDWFQVVMHRHGAGLDLFEFIDRRPRLDEPLTSYIFRQIVSAVLYLHSRSIVHRDLKDENVIIDQRFVCKLIDFGSAARFPPEPEGKFHTFCGTTEFCSPEVIRGQSYAGPELEVWALGILLYTLFFHENPFYDEQEIVKAVLPIDVEDDVSDGFYHILCWMLNVDVKARATISDVESHWWMRQTVEIGDYSFADVIECDETELHPVTHLSELISQPPQLLSPISHHGDIMPHTSV